MRFIGLTLAVLLVVGFINPFLPYWMIMIMIGILAAVANLNGVSSFMSGALGMGLAWVGQSFYLSIESGSDLPQKMADLLGAGSGMTLVAITGVIGFLAGGLSALTGSLFRKLFVRKPDNIYRGR